MAIAFTLYIAAQYKILHDPMNADKITTYIDASLAMCIIGVVSFAIGLTLRIVSKTKTKKTA
jgi:hypothetical protein